MWFICVYPKTCVAEQYNGVLIIVTHYFNHLYKVPVHVNSVPDILIKSTFKSRTFQIKLFLRNDFDELNNPTNRKF